MDALEQQYSRRNNEKKEQPGPTASGTGAGKGDHKDLYRKENRAWHDRLELVLNDKDEALGIQKNLEWAESTVRNKQTRPAGKRASGE